MSSNDSIPAVGQERVTKPDTSSKKRKLLTKIAVRLLGELLYQFINDFMAVALPEDFNVQL